MIDERITELENKLHELVRIVTDPSLWNFLTDKEREKVSAILNQQ